MKKSIALILMLAAVPAMASVDIEADASMVDWNTVLVTITYDATSEANLARVFALDIAIVGNPDINVIDVNCVNGDYFVYPGSNGIQISGGVVTDYGICVCNPGDHPDTLGGIDTNGVTIEMASLYQQGVDPTPAKSGILAVITIQGYGDANLVVTENAIRHGITMENPYEIVTVNLPAPLELPLPHDECPCYGDIADASANPDRPDGIVDLGDFGFFLMMLAGAGRPYSITPVPAWLECADVADSSANLGSDGTIDLGDFNAFIMYLAGLGAPYCGPCMTLP